VRPMGKSNLERKTSDVVRTTIEELRAVSRAKGAPVWRAVADRLESPSRNWAEVSLDKASANLKEGEIGVVPGRVLGNGSARRGLVLAAFGFSKSAREKLVAAGGKALTLTEAADSNPKGAKIRILG
jgi:large subunit ribosomal protein L18e